MLILLLAVAASSGGIGFWQALLIGAIAPALALIAYTVNFFRTRGADKRDEERHEDAQWGYTDNQGRYHPGYVETYGQRITTNEQDIARINAALERHDIK